MNKGKCCYSLLCFTILPHISLFCFTILPHVFHYCISLFYHMLTDDYPMSETRMEATRKYLHTPMDLISVRKPQPRPKVSGSNQFFSDLDVIETFATSRNIMDVNLLISQARELKLIKTLSARSKLKSDRVGFGLSTKLKSLVPNCPRTLFKFGVDKTGVFHASNQYIACMSDHHV